MGNGRLIHYRDDPSRGTVGAADLHRQRHELEPVPIDRLQVLQMLDEITQHLSGDSALQLPGTIESDLNHPEKLIRIGDHRKAAEIFCTDTNFLFSQSHNFSSSESSIICAMFEYTNLMLCAMP